MVAVAPPLSLSLPPTAEVAAKTGGEDQLPATQAPTSEAGEVPATQLSQPREADRGDGDAADLEPFGQVLQACDSEVQRHMLNSWWPGAAHDAAGGRSAGSAPAVAGESGFAVSFADFPFFGGEKGDNTGLPM